MAPSPLKVLIVVSVVAVLGGGGYFLWNGMKAKGPSPTPSPSPSPTPAEPEQQAPPGGDGEKDEQPDTPRTKKTLDLQTGVGEVYIEGSHSANTDTGPSAGDVDGLLEGKANEGEDETEVIGEKPKPSEPIDPSSTDVFANPNSAQPETRDQTIKPASFEASPPAPKEETQTEETPAPPGPEKTVSPTEPEKKPVTKPSAPASQEEVEKELSKDAQWPRPKPSASVPAPAKKPTKKEEEKKPEEKGRVDFRALMKKQRPSKVYMPDPWYMWQGKTYTWVEFSDCVKTRIEKIIEVRRGRDCIALSKDVASEKLAFPGHEDPPYYKVTTDEVDRMRESGQVDAETASDLMQMFAEDESAYGDVGLLLGCITDDCDWGELGVE